MSEKIVTYFSSNADTTRSWLAYVDLGHDYLGIRFHGATESDAYGKAETFWEETRLVREQNKERIEEGRKKAAETRAKKVAKTSK